MRVVDLEVLDLEIGDRRGADRAPVDHPVGAVEVAAPVQLDEHLDHGARVLGIHREALVLVVQRAAELLELVDDRRARLLAPVPDAPHELLAPELLARQVHAPEHALDHVLRRDARVVGAADPERLAALHAAQADEHVLHRAVERVAHVQRAGDVRRRHRDHEGLAGIVRLCREGMALLPAREHRRLDGGGVVARLGLETGAGSGVHAPRILGPAPPRYVRMRRKAAISSRKRSGGRSLPTPPTLGRRRSARSRASRLRGTASSALLRSRKRRSAASSASRQTAHVPGRQLAGLGRLDRRGGLRDDCRGARLAHHERAGREVAEALVRARREDRDRADQVEAREDVDETQHVAQRAGAERQRRAVVADHAQAAPALARACALRPPARRPPGRRTAARRSATRDDRSEGEAIGIRDDERDDQQRRARLPAGACRRAARRSASRGRPATARATRPRASRCAASPGRRCSCHQA